jgi:hypothetical protein
MKDFLFWGTFQGTFKIILISCTFKKRITLFKINLFRMKLSTLLLFTLLMSLTSFSQSKSRWSKLYDVKCRLDWGNESNKDYLILHKDGTFDLSISLKAFAQYDEDIKLISGKYQKIGNDELKMIMDEPFSWEYSNGRKIKLSKEFRVLYNSLNNKSIFISKGLMVYGKSLSNGSWRWMDEKYHYYFSDPYN